MIAKTIHKRAKRKFDRKAIRKRGVKLMRKRYKKKIGLSKVDKVWKDWVELMIVDPLIKSGSVQVDKHLSFEIVGKRIIDDNKAFGMMSKGLMSMPNGRLKKITGLNETRKGIKYSIVMTDGLFREGKLSFVADNEIKKKVSEALRKTNNYYRIEL